jgi:hypothetical protein
MDSTTLEYYLTTKLYRGCEYSSDCTKCPFVHMLCELHSKDKVLWKHKELIKKVYGYSDIGMNKDQILKILGIPKSSLVWWLNNREKISKKISNLEKYLLQPELSRI